MIKFISCRNFYLLSGGSLLLVAALVTAVLALLVFWVCFSLNHELFNSSIPKNNPIIPSKQAFEIYEWSENCFIIIRRLKLYICIYISLSNKDSNSVFVFLFVIWQFLENSFFEIYFFIFTCYDFFYRYHHFEILILVFWIRLEFEINLCIIITT